MDDRYQDPRFYGPAPPENATPPGPAKPKPKPKKQSPQETVRQFWDRFNSKYPGKVFTVLPDNAYALDKAAKTPKGAVQGIRAARSYEEAYAECENDVNRIIKECRRTNQKYKDPHFDIEYDLKNRGRDCIDGLKREDSAYMKPRGVMRVTDLFDDPQFYIDDPTAGDVRQGRDGDCFLMAALCGLGNMKGLIEKVCVKYDLTVGVYGFVFYRDGEWQTTIVDDKLYLRVPDYDEGMGQDERIIWDDINRTDSEEEYKRVHQTGSRALYFAQCSDENETWLPLLEKAFAKAHGDYAALDGGFTGEAIEDLTGGVTSEVFSTDILDKNAFWRDELLKVNREFLFGCATSYMSNWLDQNPNPAPRERQGIYEGHAYSIMEAREIQDPEGKTHRLCKLRNPWGKKEWQGRWSDGSSEWTPERMKLLDHKFGNDGIFWISYEDLLKKYQHFDRTRIFDEKWHVTQTWTSLDVPWSVVDYQNTRFKLTLKEKSPVVIVLAQLDHTYFKGLEGPYEFELQFRVQKKEDEGADYIVRSHTNYAHSRSVSTDIELEAGTYLVLMKIMATRNSNKGIEELLPEYAAERREKLIQLGLSYDLAHAKGIIVESEKEKQEREKKEKTKRAADREKESQRLRAQALKRWEKQKAYNERNKKAALKKENADRMRRMQGRSTRYRDDESAGSVDAVRGGSMDGAKDERSKQSLSNGVLKEGKKDESGVPLRIKSFSGEDVPSSKPEIGQQEQAAPDAEQDSIATAIAQDIERPGPSCSNPAASDVVQPLDEVIAEADAHTASAKMEEDKSTNTKETPLPPTPKVQINGVDAVTDVKPLPTQPGLSKPDANDDIPALAGGNNGDLADPEVGERGQDAEKQQEGGSKQEVKNGQVDGDDNVSVASSIDSFPSFDWRTDLDMSSEEDEPQPPRRRRTPASAPTPSAPNADKPAEDEGPTPDEPWNAVCVVGLRVYSMLEGDGVVVEVMRETEGEGRTMGLDRDDPSKSLVEVEGALKEGEDDEDGVELEMDQGGRAREGLRRRNH